ncbi:MAG: Mlc titration factor MtfA (ptsG expression regulator) [Arenicella sp.]
MFSKLFSRFRATFFPEAPAAIIITEQQRDILERKVMFYSTLSGSDKVLFEQYCLAFIYNTDFIGHQLDVTDADKLLVPSSSVILAWGFAQWHYVKVDTVYLVPGSFNDSSEFSQHDSNITGLVGTAHLRGKMILSQPALHRGFDNNVDKRNVAIHEFAHLIYMADGDIDGLPQQITEQGYALPWLELIARKIKDIRTGKSDIRDYGATNNAEFLSVASEYFFERPKRLKQKHPQLYRHLERFYKQNRADVHVAERIRKKAPCPCGSGKRYKHCCLKK